MPSNGCIPNTVNPDLQKERDAASFNVEEFATWFYGGEEQLKFKRYIEKNMYEEYTTYSDVESYLSYEQYYEYEIKKFIEVAKKLRKLQAEYNPGGNEIWPTLANKPILWGIMDRGNPFGVQFIMLTKALKVNATDEQYETFGKRLDNFEICATYAQTELGHGTFLRGLETRADYDKKTQEFILNTPRLSSYKWWPGGLGQSSNYCLLVAQLYIDNEPQGIQMFFVQLRDEETHMPLPGVDIGDIGLKIGLHATNNGFLGLKNVRIPRMSMLMRNAQVLPDGTFKKSLKPVLTYFTMVYVRCFIAENTSVCLSLAATIATRFSAVRRQCAINADEPEVQIIDHVTQQLKLFPEISTSIAYHLAGRSLWQLYEQTYANIKCGEYGRLPEMHVMACAMKALSTADVAAGVERLRLACGGHGYLMSSHMNHLYTAVSAACTYEGENTVLLLQVGRFLVKSWRSLESGEQLPPTIAYLAEAAALKHFPKWSGSWECLIKALQYAAANKTRTAFENLSKRMMASESMSEAANHTGIELIQAAELHGRVFICSTFLENVTGASADQRSVALNKVLRNLLELYLVQTVLRHLTDIMRFIALTDVDLRALQSRLEEALTKLRPDAVAICDGFDHKDHSLNSVLGAYDGNVYERIFDAAKKSPLNQKPVPDAFEKYLKPYLKSNL